MARRTVDERAADDAVRAALVARASSSTRADLVVATGLPEMVVERSLARLLDRYDSAVRVAPGGVLIYRFAPSWKLRAERRPLLRAALATFARAASAVSRAARAVFRFLLAVQLIAYMFAILIPVSIVVGVVVGIGFLIMAIFSSDSGGDIASALTNEYVAAVVLGLCCLGGIFWVFKKKLDLLLALVGARSPSAKTTGIDGLVTRVNDFALGPPEPRSHLERTDRTTVISLADERRVLARIRARGGVLRAGDLVRWLGLSFDAADAQATRLLVEYGGEPVPVTGDSADALSVLELRFPSLLPTADAPGRKAKGKAWLDPETSATAFERADPPPVFSSNPRRADLFVALFACINLLAALVGWHFTEPLRHRHWYLSVAWVAAGPLPLFFSALLLGLPLCRAPVLAVRKAIRLAALTRAGLVKALVAHATSTSDSLDLDALARDLPQSPDLPRLSPAESRQIALELAGEFDLDLKKARTTWHFPRLSAELRRP